jgi:hypothetical protein
MELRAGMQACVASAAALDGFYGSIRDLVQIVQSNSIAWRANKTARHAQIAEAFRLSFKIGPKSFASLKTTLEELFLFRDEAIHPTARRANLPCLPTTKLRRSALQANVQILSPRASDKERGRAD